MEGEKKEKGFVVKDRRMFSETGDSRHEDLGAEEKKDAFQVPPSESQQQEVRSEQRHGTADGADGDYPEINFINFLISLSTSAMFHFGDFPDPATNEVQVDLAAAKQTIDVISMLEDKTRNNLNEEEKKLMEAILFELRMRYVKAKAEEEK